MYTCSKESKARIIKPLENGAVIMFGVHRLDYRQSIQRVFFFDLRNTLRTTDKETQGHHHAPLARL